MNIDDWLTWPTKSTDPGVNFVVLIVLSLILVFALVVGAMFLIPILLIFAVVKGMHWYSNRPVPTADIYAQTQFLSQQAQFPKTNNFLEAHLSQFIKACRGDYPAYNVYVEMANIARKLYDEEDLANPLAPLPAASANSIEEGIYRDALLARSRTMENAQRTIDCMHSTIGTTFLTFTQHLPAIARADKQLFAKTLHGEKPLCTVPLAEVVPNIARVVQDLSSPFYNQEAEDLGLFVGLRNQLERNVYDASGIQHPVQGDKLVSPDKFKGTSHELVRTYLRDTPLKSLFDAQIPFSFSDERRYEHMMVTAGSGHGKTQLLQHLILNDLKRPKPPALIIIDSQGEMLQKIQHLDLFAPGKALSDRLIIIDPEDVGYPPALNMFDMRPPRLGSYSQTIKEQIEASIIEIFNYVFGALAAELTSKQNTTFAFVSRLLLSIPGATVHTLRELFEDGATTVETSPFADHIRALDPTSQAYFRNQFFTKTYSQTKHQIARRLYSVLQVPAFDRMFASKVNRLDMFQALQNGSVVLINTSKALLKTEASALFGRYMIARVISAAFERIALPASARNPAFLVVDEAAEYFDDNLETLLSQARKFNVGVLFAHQHLDQLAPSLRAAVAANTSIKLAGGVSDKDARALASDMRSTPDFIASMHKHPRSTEFACFVRNVSANAMRIQIPFGSVEAAPKMRDAQFSQLIARNRSRYASIPAAPSPPASGGVMAAVLRQAPQGPIQSSDADDWRS
jgi:hypothetical protein